MVLGGPVPTFSAYYIGLVNGDTVSSLGNLNLSFVPSITTVSGTSTIALSGNVTSTDSDYTIVYDPGTLTVNAPTKPIIIGLPLSKSLHIGTVYDSLTYGTILGYATNPTTVEDANGNAVSGNFDYTDGTNDVTDTVLNVGHYDLSVTFYPTDRTDYNSVTTTASIDITQAKIAIVADSPTITYGDSPTLTNTLYTDLGPDPNNSGQDDYQELDSTALASVAYTSASGYRSCRHHRRHPVCWRPHYQSDRHQHTQPHPSS